jgi:hypothetical protein
MIGLGSFFFPTSSVVLGITPFGPKLALLRCLEKIFLLLLGKALENSLNKNFAGKFWVC